MATGADTDALTIGAPTLCDLHMQARIQSMDGLLLWGVFPSLCYVQQDTYASRHLLPTWSDVMSNVFLSTSEEKNLPSTRSFSLMAAACSASEGDAGTCRMSGIERLIGNEEQSASDAAEACSGRIIDVSSRGCRCTSQDADFVTCSCRKLPT